MSAMVFDETMLKITVAILAITVAILFHLRKGSSSPSKINIEIKKDNPKVVDKYTIQDIEELPQCKEKGMAVFCRCWRSKNFPFCDGSHTKLNKDTGDNVGPLIISAK
mmetsp:Transcript_10642/g.15936  ORF Transcript_10642/g.15936 Transcript_10642/m.15936 type:complete len:108 (-) Transcript_10642:38-361(-)|eukprot:CAMPEP_0171454466 /NCGR_PEP_ID=MMETSP0945-20130129/1734_1 /TAXON_ID=109269 /ORGANISM="Vaucheria litorea, Strain CCMP2940" /LENGTH=107 /DNA_ID=CAMNT_0011979481 /DNA_START=11 /DNA_END=334 /DNA_ORIENTATION=-